MSTKVLKDRDVNAKGPISPHKIDEDRKPEVKNVEYHRQILKSKMDENHEKVIYVSPSDTIMSPCTAKLSAYRNKQVGKAKPKSLFTKTTSKSIECAEGIFGSSNSNNTFQKSLEDSRS
ncbi:putative spo12-like protein [Golovinomyces cichoracearum]|uniref:Putative spo12-like protein n=1 Tax=Golovinomyces cichoracearum TaxID=62708 RepID=A0A420IXD6_9PEZI|nr:putative spo12-like protein [Golovinomyces cichoracearum]